MLQSPDYKASDTDVDVGARRFVISGANSGLGRALTLQLSRMGAQEVVMLCRDRSRGETARAEIVAESGRDNVSVEEVDVSRPQQVVQFAKAFVASGKSIDALINNAGVLNKERRDTPEGFEETFAVHSLGPYLLTDALMPALARCPRTARVINMSSGGLYTTKMDVEHFQSPHATWSGSKEGLEAYSQCKRHQLYFVEIWAKRFAAAHPNVVFHCTHPGWAKTPGTDSSLPAMFQKLPLRTPAQGVDTALWLAVADHGPAVSTTGQFWFDRAPACGEFAEWANDNSSSAADIAKLAAHMDQLKAELNKS